MLVNLQVLAADAGSSLYMNNCQLSISCPSLLPQEIVGILRVQVSYTLTTR
jgi:hypothetical protein